MIKVVIDANVFVSALLKPNSIPDKIIRLAKDKRIQPLISPNIISEIKSVLLYPKIQKIHQQTSEEIDIFVESFTKNALLIISDIKLDVINDDPSDNKFLECAVAGKAEFIISGDKHLKDLKEYQGIQIVSPVKFIEIVRG